MNRDVGSIRKLKQLTRCIPALWGSDFADSVFCTKAPHEADFGQADLRQRNGLMIYNKIERVLVITKQILNYYNTIFSLEIT